MCLTASLNTLPYKSLEECTFWTWEWIAYRALDPVPVNRKGTVDLSSDFFHIFLINRAHHLQLSWLEGSADYKY